MSPLGERLIRPEHGQGRESCFLDQFETWKAERRLLIMLISQRFIVRES
jgi:hypothetical protein